MKRFLDLIYKKERCDATHYRVTLFSCIRFSYLNESARELSKENDFLQYKKQNIDITTVPKAKGQLRKIQLANLVLLLELDKVCKANGLRYWLDFGNAIGAIRHKGYIPWDDDIDCGMLREDYDKIAEAFEKSSSNPDIYVEYFRGRVECFLKVRHRKNPHVFVDIFPYDLYDRKLSESERKAVSKIAIETRDYIKAKQNKKSSNEEHLDWIFKLRDERILKNGSGKEEDCPDVFWGLDYNHPYKNWFFDYETFFPLKTTEYEGFQFPVINKLEVYLENLFGNYMLYPSIKNMKHKHSMLVRMSGEELEILDLLANSINNNDKNE